MSTEPVKVLCFDTLLQVLILKALMGAAYCMIKRVRNVLMGESMGAHCAQVERLEGAGFARRTRRTGWDARFMRYDSTKLVCCQEKYILGELLVRANWEVVGGARVTEDQYAPTAMA